MGLSTETRRAGEGSPFDHVQAERIRRGDRVAFQKLFHANYDALCAYASLFVRSSQVAEDLVQEVFCDLWKRRCMWHPEYSTKAFLFGAVRHQTCNYRRRLRVQEQIDDSTLVDGLLSQEDPEQLLHGNELRRIAQEAIDELPERRREIFVLSREHHLTYAEIASRLGISIKTVETQMGRALHYLRDRLAGLGVYSTSPTP